MIDNPLNRLNVKRGSDLPQAILTDEDVQLIRQAQAERNRLRAQAAQLSNRALAEKFGVHHRTIDRITSGHGWTHID